MKKSLIASIDDALHHGLHLHSFRSGGGLRVLVLSDDKDKGVYYGEYCDFENALRILKDDVKAGGRKYEDVYGDDKPELHYLTGAYATGTDVLDDYVCSGYSVDAKATSDGNISVTMQRRNQGDFPKDIFAMVANSGPVRWKYKHLDTVFISEPTDALPGGVTIRTEDGSQNDYFDTTPITSVASTFDYALAKCAGEWARFRYEHEIL